MAGISTVNINSTDLLFVRALSVSTITKLLDTKGLVQETTVYGELVKLPARPLAQRLNHKLDERCTRVALRKLTSLIGNLDLVYCQHMRPSISGSVRSGGQVVDKCISQLGRVVDWFGIKHVVFNAILNVLSK